MSKPGTDRQARQDLCAAYISQCHRSGEGNGGHQSLGRGCTRKGDIGYKQMTARSPGTLLPSSTAADSNSVLDLSKNFKEGLLNVLPLRNDQCLRRVICLTWLKHYAM